MGSLSRATNETTRGMRAFLLLLLVAANLSDALSTLNGRVDEEHNAIVVEALRARSGRAFSWFSGTPSSPFAGMFPAATQPLAPAAPGQQVLCRAPSGALTFCQANYQWPGQYPGGAPGGFPGAPGGFPGAPGGFPGQGGGFPGAQPGWPQAPQQPQQPQWPPPVPTHPPQPAQPVQTPQPVPTSPPVAPVVAETTTKAPVTNRPAGSSPGQCGVGRYHPIRYDSNGQVAEEVERANEAGAKIVNGWDADQGEWPWIAALLNNNRQFCGGSLITQKHILTAAHCVAHMSRYDVANLKVRLGDHEIRTVGETEVFESKAARVVRHKEFSQQTLHKDVAIISLENPVPTSMANVRPVCLPSGHQKYAGQTATVVGWGSLKENGPQPNTLMEVTVKIWDNPTCKDTYGNAAPGGIMDHMMCAGQKGKDSCSGDSGGPMSIGTGTSWTQIGIVSWGIGCDKSHYPGVYTRVTAVKSWIDKI